MNMPAELQAAINAERVRVNGHAGHVHDSRSWLPVDLAAIVAGDHAEEPPAFVTRTDGVALLYAGKLHLVSGEPEAGKGWLACHACAERLRAGEAAVYFDFEDTATTIVSRLLALGVPGDAILERFSYVRPDDPLSDATWPQIVGLVGVDAPALAVIDGVTEALTLHGLDLKDNADVAKWRKLLPRRLANLGPAVVEIDHVGRDREARGRYSIGAQHKLAGVDVAYTLEVVEPFARGREGRVKVKVHKDRPGFVREHAEGALIATMRLTSHIDGSVGVALEPPTERGAAFRPTYLMERVSVALEEAPGGMSKRAIRAAVSGRNDVIDLALELLVSDGYVDRHPDGRTIAHNSVRPYRESDDEGHENSDRAHVPHRAPNVPGHTLEATVPMCPRPIGAHGTEPDTEELLP